MYIVYPRSRLFSTTQAPSTTQAATQASGNESSIGTTSRTPVSLSDADINLMAAVMTLECGNEEDTAILMIVQHLASNSTYDPGLDDLSSLQGSFYDPDIDHNSYLRFSYIVGLLIFLI